MCIRDSKYIKKKFGEGNLQIMADFSQVEDLETETYTLSLTDFETNISEIKSHSYQAIGQTEHWLDNRPIGFKATLINNGLNKYLDKKNNTFANKNYIFICNYKVYGLGFPSNNTIT